jgi:acetyl-CoA carboxylase biotin carboxyl carrier protein
MDIEKLKKFMDFMNENGLAELEIEEEGKKIRLKKTSTDQPIMVAANPVQSPATANSAAAAGGAPDAGSIEIKSPMVGTFYRAASPGAKSYVDVGETIKPGDVVCIIEAMKLMNEIKAETGGKIIKILAENGQPIEFGQPLFVLETA